MTARLEDCSVGACFEERWCSLDVVLWEDVRESEAEVVFLLTFFKSARRARSCWTFSSSVASEIGLLREGFCGRAS